MSGNHPQQRSLATARRAEKTAIERVFDLQVDLPHGDGFTVYFLQAFQLEVKGGFRRCSGHGKSIRFQLRQNPSQADRQHRGVILHSCDAKIRSPLFVADMNCLPAAHNLGFLQP